MIKVTRTSKSKDYKGSVQQVRLIIREYCILVLSLHDVYYIGKKIIKNCSTDEIRSMYFEVVGTDPFVEYLSNRHKIVEQIDLDRQNGLNGDYVYFFVSTDFSFVKIGYSNNPNERIKSVQTGCPLELSLAGYINGTTQDEYNFHQKYKYLNTFGEWFLLKGSLRAFIIRNFFIHPDYMTQKMFHLSKTVL